MRTGSHAVRPHRSRQTRRHRRRRSTAHPLWSRHLPSPLIFSQRWSSFLQASDTTCFLTTRAMNQALKISKQ
ncbi:unnamed protein product [Leptidea sinapis]|uniref:Uncharacterized protein n=1 Tax=Leptidea sinapis TaxID=189913 RepID=A0A5E4PM29_9NEOP|nr:unnamed protein product [Leptidea sinapis]